MAFIVTSPAFRNGNAVPKQFTCDGSDTPPPLEVSGAPEGTRSFAVIMDDPDAPNGTFTHWLMWDIPITREGLPEDVGHEGDFTDGARQGDNDFGERGYSGPKPPRGETHHYHFKLFALDAPLKLEEGAHKDELLRAMKGHVLDQAEVVGLYRR